MKRVLFAFSFSFFALNAVGYPTFEEYTSGIKMDILVEQLTNDKFKITEAGDVTTTYDKQQLTQRVIIGNDNRHVCLWLDGDGALVVYDAKNYYDGNVAFRANNVIVYGENIFSKFYAESRNKDNPIFKILGNIYANSCTVWAKGGIYGPGNFICDGSKATLPVILEKDWSLNVGYKCNSIGKFDIGGFTRASKATIWNLKIHAPLDVESLIVDGTEYSGYAEYKDQHRYKTDTQTKCEKILRNADDKNLMRRDITQNKPKVVSVRNRFLNQIARENIRIGKEGHYTAEGKEYFLPNRYAESIFINKAFRDEKLKRDTDQHYIVCKADAITLAQALAGKGYEVCLLNPANAIRTGGGFAKGETSFEEQLFYYTLLICSLKQQEQDYYEKNYADGCKLFKDGELKQDVTIDDIKKWYGRGMVLSPNVFIIRDNNFNLIPHSSYSFSVISGALPHLGRGGNGHAGGDAYIAVGSDKEKEEALYEGTKEQIRNLIKALAHYKFDCIILPEWGCGAFGNDAEKIASYFHEVLVKEGYGQHFKWIIFTTSEVEFAKKFADVSATSGEILETVKKYPYESIKTHPEKIEDHTIALPPKYHLLSEYKDVRYDIPRGSVENSDNKYTILKTEKGVYTSKFVEEDGSVVVETEPDKKDAILKYLEDLYQQRNKGKKFHRTHQSAGGNIFEIVNQLKLLWPRV